MKHNSTQSWYFPDLVVSGGQSGADMGGLLAAKSLGIATGGYAPKHFKTENGDKPELGTVFGLLEAPTDHYADRTATNIEMSNAVILIARKFESAGSRLTHKLAVDSGKPIFEVVFPTHAAVEDPIIWLSVLDWLHWHEPSVIMVAGNRESVAPGIEQWTREFITELFS